MQRASASLKSYMQHVLDYLCSSGRRSLMPQDFPFLLLAADRISSSAASQMSETLKDNMLDVHTCL